MKASGWAAAEERRKAAWGALLLAQRERDTAADCYGLRQEEARS